MCGIAGIIDTGLGLGRDEIARLATAMRDTMVHRGVFNGEIYNHRALRAELEREGHAFRSKSDTEVLCHMF